METSTLTSSLYLLVLGLGLGSVMQVLVLAVQNAVRYEVLGAATSGATLFRGIGGSLGAAVVGTIFSSRLTSQLKALLTGSLAHQVVGAASGVAVVVLALSCLLPEHPLRDAAATSRGLDDGLAAPRSPDALAEVQRALSRTVSADRRAQFRERLALRVGIELSPGATWALVRIGEHGLRRARELADQEGVPAGRVTAVIEELRAKSLIAGERRGAAVTESGRRCAERAIAVRREPLSEALADETAHRDPAVDELLHRLARELAGEPPAVAA